MRLVHQDVEHQVVVDVVLAILLKAQLKTWPHKLLVLRKAPTQGQHTGSVQSTDTRTTHWFCAKHQHKDNTLVLRKAPTQGHNTHTGCAANPAEHQANVKPQKGM
eukprot:scaffold141523_cov21-Tisochrysis_lutea.AAC.5